MDERGPVEVNDRIFLADDQLWYYRTRGNNKVGPFETRADAERRLERQLTTWKGRIGTNESQARTNHSPRLFRRSATRQS